MPHPLTIERGNIVVEIEVPLVMLTWPVDIMRGAIAGIVEATLRRLDAVDIAKANDGAVGDGRYRDPACWHACMTVDPEFCRRAAVDIAKIVAEHFCGTIEAEKRRRSEGGDQCSRR